LDKTTDSLENTYELFTQFKTADILTIEHFEILLTPDQIE
jgi:hypothetical protein